MSLQVLELQRGGKLAISRASSTAMRHLHAVSDLRRRAEIAVVERLNPSVSIESLPLVMLIAVLMSLIASRRP
jgi:hypothetical protein